METVEANVVSSTATELVITVPSGLPENLDTQLVVSTDGGESIAPGKFWIGDNLLLNGGLELETVMSLQIGLNLMGRDRMTATTADGEAFFNRSLTCSRSRW